MKHAVHFGKVKVAETDNRNLVPLLEAAPALMEAAGDVLNLAERAGALALWLPGESQLGDAFARLRAAWKRSTGAVK